MYNMKAFAWVRLLTAERSSGPPLRFALACSIAGQFGGCRLGLWGVVSPSVNLRRRRAVVVVYGFDGWPELQASRAPGVGGDVVT